MPAIGETIDTSRRAIAFISVDLPTLGGPAMTTLNPSRRRSPDGAEASVRRMRAAAVSTRRWICAEPGGIDILLIGKIDLRLDPRHRLDDQRADRLGFAAQRAAGDAQGLAPLRLGLGVDEIGEAFDLGKIEFAVFESAQREFAGIGGPHVRQLREGFDDGGQAPRARR